VQTISESSDQAAYFGFGSEKQNANDLKNAGCSNQASSASCGLSASAQKEASHVVVQEKAWESSNYKGFKIAHDLPETEMRYAEHDAGGHVN